METAMWPTAALVGQTEGANFNGNNLQNSKETTLCDCFSGHNEALLLWWLVR